VLIYITRHGQTYWNDTGKTQGIKDIPLNDKGREQAVKLARRLWDAPVQAIYTSDLKRATETGNIIGNAIGKVCLATPHLREANFGEWEGLTIKEIEEIFPGQLESWYEDPGFRAPGGESINCVKKRVRCFIDQIKELDIDKDQGILVVSHALTSKLLIIELLGLPISFIQRIKLSNAGLTIIRAIEGESALLLHNDTCHLYE
jgi:broad specificity phosphatase PhoE